MTSQLGNEFPPGLSIGLLGGSFNPAHAGHRAISLVALNALGLDRVVWLVSPQNPLKAPGDLADYETRIDAARNMAQHSRIDVSDFEARLHLRYTIDTITTLKARHPCVRFVLLIGADNLVQLPRWKDWTRLFTTMPIAVFARPGSRFAALASKPAQRYRERRLPAEAARRLIRLTAPVWTFLPYTHRAESATAIRAAGDWPA